MTFSPLRLVLVLFVATLFSPFGRTLLAAETASPLTVEIADVGKSGELAQQLSAKGYRTIISQKNIWVTDPQNNCAVWIGKMVPLDMLRAVLPEAIRFNPNLKFYHVVGDRGEQPPEQVNNTIHVGGSIEAAMVKKLNQIDNQELLELLKKAKSIGELHQYLHEKNIPREKATEKPA